MSSQPPTRPSPGRPEVSSSDAMLYSVQINQTPGSPCAVCASNPSAEGPVGHLDDAPVCDICLLVGAKELGMLVALAVLVRAFAHDAAHSTTSENKESLSLLVVFARIYDRQATWPRRNEFSDDLMGDGPEGDDQENDSNPENDSGLH